MRAVVVRRAGGWDRLSVEERPSPPLGAGELRIAVRAAGVNFADVAVRMGLYSSAKKYVGWPITPGFEVAGRVREVGPGVEDVAIGDEVMAVTRFGGYASEVVVPRHQAWPLPAALDLFQAAGFPAVALTAYFALFELAHPRAGDTLLVHSPRPRAAWAACWCSSASSPAAPWWASCAEHTRSRRLGRWEPTP